MAEKPMDISTSHQCLSYGIFWDIENCPIPNGRADTAVQNIKQFIGRQYEAKVGHTLEPCTFVCACNTRNLDPHHAEALNRCGVDILHVNPTRPNQNFKVVADDKLKECIQKFIEHHSRPDKCLIFVITGDIDFAPQIRTARRAGFQVILLYGLQTSGELKKSVNEGHCYNRIVSPLPAPNPLPDINVTHSQRPSTDPFDVPMSSNRSRQSAQSTAANNPFDISMVLNKSQVSGHSTASSVPPFIENVRKTVSQIETQNQIRDKTTKETNERKIDENKLRALQELTKLDRHQAIQMLENTKWDVELAANILFND